MVCWRRPTAGLSGGRREDPGCAQVAAGAPPRAGIRRRRREHGHEDIQRHNVRSLLGLKSDWYRFDSPRSSSAGSRSAARTRRSAACSATRNGSGGTADFRQGRHLLVVDGRGPGGVWRHPHLVPRDRRTDHALGLPIAPRVAAGPGATVQRFRVGRMFWSAATATREVYGRIYTAYYNAGLDSGRLGLPSSYQTATPPAHRPCEAGRIEWNSATNATTVIYN